MATDRSGPGRWRQRLFVTLLTAAVAIGSWYLGTQGTTTPEAFEATLATAEVEPPTAEVVERRLAVTVVGRGSARYEGSTPVVLSRLPGVEGSEPLVTDTPAIGSMVAPGQALIEVAYRPVIALAGGQPLVRDLRHGDQGRDVEVLQRGLQGAGVMDGDIDGRFGPDTESALRALYESAGYPRPVETGRVVALASEMAVVPDGPLVVRTRLEIGQRANTTDPVVTLSRDRAVLVGSVTMTEAKALKPDQEAVIVDETLEAEYPATVVRVGTEPEPNSGLVPVWIDAGMGDLQGGREYRFEVVTAATPGASLAVPETALAMGVDGDSYVTVYNGSSTRIPVSPGLSGSDGYVAIVPQVDGSLQPGDRVVIGAP